MIHGLNRIEKKIQQGLSEPFRADFDKGKTGLHFLHHSNALGLDVCLGKPQGAAKYLAKVCLYRFKRAGAGKVEQFRNHAVEALHLVDHALCGFFLAPAKGHAAGDIQGNTLDGAERIADFMGHTRCQMAKGGQPVVALGIGL